MNKDKIIEIFLKYLSLGFSVIPIAYKTKKPLIPWAEYQKRRATVEEIKAWVCEYYPLNIGIVTGAISGVAIIDVDIETGGLETLRKLPELAETPKVKTGTGGFHNYFKHPGFTVSNFQKKAGLPGIDFRGDGGYVVAPGSIHECGGAYEWVIPLNGNFAELPEWILAKHKEDKTPIKQLLTEYVPEGIRGDSVARIAGQCFYNKMNIDETLSFCLTWHERRNKEKVEQAEKEPFTKDDVIKTVNSIYNKHQKDNVADEGSNQIVEIDSSHFNELTTEEIQRILGITIKKDDHNKVICLIAGILTYSEQAQINLAFNAPSSTGKSYIPIEISKYFSQDDVREMGYTSPTAFFHEKGEYDDQRNCYTVNLERKLMLFIDQPHPQVLEHLRPILSHDKKEVEHNITDKSERKGLKTKKVIIRGFPTVMFCSANSNMDEQEMTRFFRLSPEETQEKIREAIYLAIKKNSDHDSFEASIESCRERKLLKERILGIKQSGVRDVVIRLEQQEQIRSNFFSKASHVKARHTRDITRLISIIKGFALLNLWFRDRDKNRIYANDKDIEEAFNLWNTISEPQEYNLSPHQFEVFKNVYIPAWSIRNEEELKNNSLNGEGVENDPKDDSIVGIERKNISRKYYEIYYKSLSDNKLKNDYLKQWDYAGLVNEIEDPDDRRKKLVTPTPVGLFLIDKYDHSNSEPGEAVI